MLPALRHKVVRNLTAIDQELRLLVVVRAALRREAGSCRLLQSTHSSMSGWAFVPLSTSSPQQGVAHTRRHAASRRRPDGTPCHHRSPNPVPLWVRSWRPHYRVVVGVTVLIAEVSELSTRRAVQDRALGRISVDAPPSRPAITSVAASDRRHSTGGMQR